MPEITVVIPCSPQHVHLLPRALASVRQQTVKCETVVIMDDGMRGAGWSRNRGLEKVDTEFVTFLDADDQIKPLFAERTLARHRQTGRYVYTDYEYSDGVVVEAPECAWMNKTHHIVTTLIPTAWAKAVGGFDETMTAVEDAEFYAHLITSNYCGTRLAEVLFIYSRDVANTSRSKRAADDGRQVYYEGMIRERYRGKDVVCCGAEKEPDPPLDPAPEGMVYVLRNQGGKANVYGASGRFYGRHGNDRPFLMTPEDAVAQPGMYTVIAPPVTPVPAPPRIIDEQAEWSAFGKLIAPMIAPEPPPPPYVPQPAPVSPSKPDYGKLKRVFAKVNGSTSKPVFVFPDKEYPSYTDARKLVRLSGYDVMRVGQALSMSNYSAPYIFLSPEQPPDLLTDLYRQRMIWWAMEYGGEYEPDLTNWKGEVWASDPKWAADHNAKYVLMGSHPGLMSEDAKIGNPVYDYCMLAYMVPRRQAIKDQLTGLRTPEIVYPGYTAERDEQLLTSKLMLHVHQHEGVQAVPPQRFALAAAYRLPVVSEQIPGEHGFDGIVRFDAYSRLAEAVREELAMGILKQRGERLHEYLCIENTFAKTVEGALK